MLRADLAAPLLAAVLALVAIAWVAWGSRSHDNASDHSPAVDRAVMPAVPDHSQTVPRPSPAPAEPRRTAPSSGPRVDEPVRPVPASPVPAIAPSLPPATPHGPIDEHPELDAMMDQIEFPDAGYPTAGQRLHQVTVDYQRLRAHMSEMDASLQSAERSGDTAAQQRIITRFRRLRTQLLSLQAEGDDLRGAGVVDPLATDAGAH